MRSAFLQINLGRVKLLLSDPVYQLDPADGDCRILKLLESQHRIYPLLHSSMILLDHVVEVFARANTNVNRQDGRLLQLTNSPMRRRVAIECNLFWGSISVNCAREKPLGGLNVSMFAQQKVYGLTLLINCPIKILPFASNSDVCFIHSPRRADGASKSTPLHFEHGNVAQYPSQDCEHERD